MRALTPDTGKSGLQNIADKLSFIPIPLVGSTLSWGVGMVATVWESAQWLFRGKIASAATTLAAGTVRNAVNSATGVFAPLGGKEGINWFLKAGFGLGTGVTFGEAAASLTEKVIGKATGVFGVKPQVLQSHTAGIGSIGGGMSLPDLGVEGEATGRSGFLDKLAAERGQTVAELHRANSDGDHLAALEHARATQPDYRMSV